MTRVTLVTLCFLSGCELLAGSEAPADATLRQDRSREATGSAPALAATPAPATRVAPGLLLRQLTVTPLGLGMLELGGSQVVRVVEPPRHGDLQTAPGAVYYRHRGGAGDDHWELLVDGRRVLVSVAVRAVPTAAGSALFWLDAAAVGATAQDGAAVGSWPSRSGAAIALAGSAAPRWALHGAHARLPAVRFDAEDSLRAATPLSGGPYTWMAALRRDAEAGGDRPAAVVSAFGGRGGLYLLGDYAAARCYQPGQTTDFVTAPKPMTGWTVITGRWNGRWHELYVDGQLVGALPWAAAPLTGPLVFGKGESSVAESFRGWLGEALVFDRDLAPEERANLERYLMAKWGDAAAVTGLDGVAAASTAPCWIAGSDASEVLGGGAGDDVIEVGDGDEAYGGLGADTFVVRDTGRSRIEDFEPGVDTLDVSALIADRTVALEDCVALVHDDAGLIVRVGGAEVLLSDCAGLNTGDLKSGLETSLAGATELAVEVVTPDGALRVGQPAQWLVTARFGDTRKRVVRSDLSLQGNLRALADSRGRLTVMGPGPLGLVAHVGDRVVDAGALEALPPPPLAFEVEPSPPLSTPMAAYQGGVWVGDQLFVTANRQVEGAWLFRLNSEWQLEAETAIPTLNGVPMHVGAVTAHGRTLYAPLLDPKSQGAAEPLTGLAVLDADSLEVSALIDTTGMFRYLDAATVHGDDLWLATTTELVRVPLDAAGPNLEARESYVLRGDVGVLQGIAIAGDYVYVVPENGTASHDMLGIVVYRRSDLKPVPALPQYSGVASWFVSEWANLPVGRYAAAFPAAAPDHESLFFDRTEPTVAYLPWIPGGPQLARLRLTLPGDGSAD